MHIHASSGELRPPFACGESPCHADETLSNARSFWERYPAKWLMGCFMERYVPKPPERLQLKSRLQSSDKLCEKTALCLGDEDHMLATSAVHPYDRRDQLQ
ncbi:hypothetical protein GB937_007395 [Aspergillus fischeri]|nr:hypothetical protein GB937_007395 [Aspergillus fischeri]